MTGERLPNRPSPNSVDCIWVERSHVRHMEAVMSAAVAMMDGRVEYMRTPGVLRGADRYQAGLERLAAAIDALPCRGAHAAATGGHSVSSSGGHVDALNGRALNALNGSPSVTIEWFAGRHQNY